jgi:predicted RNA-binding protein with PIN domain
MKHTTEIVKTEQASDEAVSIIIRCCSDPKTDSALTVYGIAKLSADEMAKEIDKHHDRVAMKHAGMVAGKLRLSEVSKTKEHKA